VDLVDSVAHSMGGLIVRSYRSGKGSAAGVFTPPAVIHLRKIVFVATPHFGAGITAGYDLRGVDAIAMIGNGAGNATTDGLDDGVIALTSTSLGFYLPGRTRVLLSVTWMEVAFSASLYFWRRTPRPWIADQVDGAARPASQISRVSPIGRRKAGNELRSASPLDARLSKRRNKKENGPAPPEDGTAVKRPSIVAISSNVVRGTSKAEVRHADLSGQS
jgi:hypothetical protein